MSDPPFPEDSAEPAEEGGSPSRREPSPEEPERAPAASDGGPGGGEDPDEAPAVDPESLLPMLEAVLFASPSPMTPQAFKKVFGESANWESIRAGLQLLGKRCSEPHRGILLCEVAGGWQLMTREEYWPYVQRIAKVKHDERLSPAAIETLSVIAYKQPVTRAGVDAIRGVSSGALIRTLMDRGLVRVTGRAEAPGHPFEYGTTQRFLQHFGLAGLRDLPDPRDLGRLLTDREATLDSGETGEAH